MPEIPTFSEAAESAKDATQSIQNHGRTLIPWLPNPPECGNCGAMMYAGVTYDPKMVDYVDCWECKECGRQTYRDDPGPEPEPPSPGAPEIRDALQE